MNVIELLEKLDKEATQRPWFLDTIVQFSRFKDEDAQLISTLRNMLPELIAMIKNATAVRGDLTAEDEDEAPTLTHFTSWFGLCEALEALNKKAEGSD